MPPWTTTEKVCLGAGVVGGLGLVAYLLSSQKAVTGAALPANGSSTAATSSNFATPVTVEVNAAGALPPLTVLGTATAAEGGNIGLAPAITLQMPDGAYLQDVTSSDDSVFLAPSFSGGPGTNTLDLGSAEETGHAQLTITWFDITGTQQVSTLVVTVG
jgi:hypothetical protein